ncbi:MAG: hypothetical protein PHW19_09930 [Salinivirgaceae bacterium]|nr:hypothetical protein [Salinivirgaceae bacterium]
MENPKDLNELREKRISDLLSHVVETVPFYESIPQYAKLSDFPVVNKNLIRTNFQEFQSTAFKDKQLFPAITSGSTGTPFKVYKDKGKIIRHQAENIFFSEIAGYKFGTRLYYLRVWNAINRKSKLKSWMQNIIMQDADDISFQKMDIFFKKIKKDKTPKTILAFASTYEGIVRYIKEKKEPVDNYNVRCILTISETLPEKTKEELRAIFKCPVVSRYSNIENGFIAQQCLDENNEYHINTSGFFVELLNLNNDNKVIDGELGRIVITDLFNYAMPLIRYDTGDLARISQKAKCSLLTPVFTKIEGRRVDFIYNTNNNLLSPHVITNTMWKFTEVVQFQFIQNTEKEYHFKLNCVLNKLADENLLISEIKKYVGNDAIISIEYVDEIPLLSSGKRKKIINNFRPNG